MFKLRQLALIPHFIIYINLFHGTFCIIIKNACIFHDTPFFKTSQMYNTITIVNIIQQTKCEVHSFRYLTAGYCK